MSTPIFLLILLAASLHASWNAIIKRAGHKAAMAVAVSVAAALVAAVAVPWMALPAMGSWPWAGASAVLQVIYMLLVARTYHVADMGQTYPLMRGTAPMLVALAGVFVFHESLHTGAWLGIAAIGAGILAMAIGVRGMPRRTGTGPALANAVVIAGYTLVDGVGVRLSHAPLAYAVWGFVLNGTLMALIRWRVLREALRENARRRLPLALLGGVATLASYTMALWAMTRAPVAMIAALRETSILFGLVISAWLLGERIGRVRVAAAVVVAAGAVALRLA